MGTATMGHRMQADEANVFHFSRFRGEEAQVHQESSLRQDKALQHKQLDSTHSGLLASPILLLPHKHSSPAD